MMTKGTSIDKQAEHEGAHVPLLKKKKTENAIFRSLLEFIQ